MFKELRDTAHYHSKPQDSTPTSSRKGDDKHIKEGIIKESNKDIKVFPTGVGIQSEYME